jgi:hypothetical protein
MRGFIEIKEDAYEDTIEHLYRMKAIACKMIKKLSEHSELYDKEYEDDEEEYGTRRRNNKGRYSY